MNPLSPFSKRFLVTFKHYCMGGFYNHMIVASGKWTPCSHRKALVPEAGIEPTGPCFAPWAYKHGVTPVPAYRQPELHRGREKTALPVLRRGHVEGVQSPGDPSPVEPPAGLEPASAA